MGAQDFVNKKINFALASCLFDHLTGFHFHLSVSPFSQVQCVPCFVLSQVKVMLHSAHRPTHSSVTSVGAGGLWMPFKCDDPRVDKWSIETLDELLDYKKKNCEAFNKLVESVPAIYLRKQNDMKAKTLPAWTQDPRLGFDHMNIEMLEWQNEILNLRFPFSSSSDLVRQGYSYCWFFQAPIVDAPNMLEHMLEKVTSHPLNVGTTLEMEHPYESLDEMVKSAKELGCDAVVNCTGLASRKLCSDKSLFPGRGVLLLYDRSSARHPVLEEPAADGSPKRDVCVLVDDPPLGSNEEPIYMIPRGDVIAVGGSYYEHDTETQMRPAERKRLLLNAQMLGIDTSRAEPLQEWVGSRPCRPTVRLELDSAYSNSNTTNDDEENNFKVVHNYGHGGSGWTVFTGAAKAAADLLTTDLSS
jgi:D-amino-acid oxidase